MSDRDKALYHLQEWWLAGNDETLHHAGAKLLEFMRREGWIERGTRVVMQRWSDGEWHSVQGADAVATFRLSYFGREVLMDWMRAKWTSSRPGKTIEQMKEAIGHE